jgi:hypothetical protein
MPLLWREHMSDETVTLVALKAIKKLEQDDHPAGVLLAFSLIGRHLMNQGYTEDELHEALKATKKKTN